LFCWTINELEIRSPKTEHLAKCPQGAFVHARIPFVGKTVNIFVRAALPQDTRIGVRMRSGLGKGLALYLDPRFEMDYVGGNYERLIQEALAAYLKPGSVFYDVGAHLGVLSMFANELVGSTGCVFAFEADPENAERIKTHARRNNLARLQVISCAVWSCARQLQFERASLLSSRNQGSVRSESTESKENTLTVESISLDNFVYLHPPPTVIKIDVEGAEAEVLRGSEQILSRSRPVLICEVHHKQAEEAVTAWLRQQSYSFEWLEASAAFPRHLLARPAR
jgi:FkbM family methyltransferase